MFIAVPTWCLLLLAVSAIVSRRWNCLLQLFGAKSFRMKVLGGPADVAPSVANSRYADYHGQLIDLGFEPLGVFEESLPGTRGGDEYVFVHAGHGCRAMVHGLDDGVPQVCLKSDMADGRLVATRNYGGEELDQETADCVEWCHPTHSLEELLEEHEHARYAWVSDGAKLIAPRTIQEAADLETGNFFNRSVHRGFRRHLIEKMAWGLPIVALISVGAAWALPGVFWRLFSLSVICCTAAGYLLEKWCERSARQEIVEERGVESVARSEAAVA